MERQTHKAVHNATGIAYNNLLRWNRGETVPGEESLKRIADAGFDTTPYARHVVKRYAKYVISMASSALVAVNNPTRSSLCDHDNAFRRTA